MCGIIGCYAKQETRVTSVLIDGLRRLEYRGYDSSGIAVLQQGRVQIQKEKGNIKNLEEALGSCDLKGRVGIAHTRWATHGKATINNAHPHHVNHTTLVHNGIIENYHELRLSLEKEGYVFLSETDSEVACALIDSFYNKFQQPLQAIQEATKQIEGSYAFGILFDDDEHLYAVRRNSPLLLGVGENYTYIASDVGAMGADLMLMYPLKEEHIAVLAQDVLVYDKNLQQQTIDFVEVDALKDAYDKEGYAHYMLKEMYEEPKLIDRLQKRYASYDFEEFVSSIKDVEEYHIVACGSALYAGMIAQEWLLHQGIRASVHYASEYRYHMPYHTKQTAVIFISQSGETADTYACVTMCKELGLRTIGVVNVEDSLIANTVDQVFYTYAGKEVSVATTKAYIAQIYVLSKLVELISHQTNEMYEDCRKEEALPKTMEVLLHTSYQNASNYLANKEDVYFIGRGMDYAFCMEACLKLKEISYIHSEAYPAGELKHGSIALIEEGTPVIAIATDSRVAMKTIGNIQEVKARGAYVILIKGENISVDENIYDICIELPDVDMYSKGLLSVLPLQKIAYETALARGCEIDQPRNLAKSVTVE